MAEDLMPSPTAPTGFGPSDSAPIRQGEDYRQLQQAPELLQPWHIPGSGKEQEAQALSRTFKDFSKMADSFGDKLAVQGGRAAGAAAGAAPGFQPKTGLAAITESGQAFNAAAHVTYVANTQTAIESSINDAEQANPRDPVGYAQTIAAVREQTLKQVPPLYQPEIQTMFDRRVAAGQSRIADQTIKGNQTDAEYAYTSTWRPRLDTAIRTASDLPADQAAATMQQFMHDDATMRKGLVNPQGWSQERADAVGTQVANMTAQAVHENYAKRAAGGFMDTVRAGNVDEADRQVNKYLTDPANSEADKESVQQEFEKQRHLYTEAQSQLHAQDIDSIGQQLIQGKDQLNGQGAYGPAIEGQIRGMYNRGWVTPETSRAMLDEVQRNEIKGTRIDSSNQIIDDALHSGRALDPADKEVVKATGPYFDAQVQAQHTAYGTPLYAAAAASFAHTTNIVPPSVKASIRVGILSNDPQQVAYASQLADKLHQANPQAALFDDSEPKLATLSSLVNDNLKTGASPEQALSLASAQVNVTPEQKKARDDEYSAALKKVSTEKPEMVNAAALQNRMNSAFGHFWQSAPTASVPMRAEFDSLTHQFYAQTGDLGKAQDLASAQLLKSWGPSKVNGTTELMKWPIPDADVPRVQQGMADTARANDFQGDPKSLALTSFPGAKDPRTIWGMTYVDKDGFTQPVLGKDNRPVPLDISKGKPDFAAQTDVLAQQKRAAFDKARASQQQMDRVAGQMPMFAN